MECIHIVRETNGGWVRTMCRKTTRNVVAIPAHKTFPDGQNICEECLKAYYKEVCPPPEPTVVGIRQPQAC